MLRVTNEIVAMPIILKNKNHEILKEILHSRLRVWKKLLIKMSKIYEVL